MPMPAHKGTSAKRRMTIDPSAPKRMTIAAIANATTDAARDSPFKDCMIEPKAG
jgi:hypothetical protein